MWCNVLNLGAQNGWIDYKKSTGKKISQKQFILELVEELRSLHTQARNPTHAPLPTVFENNQGSITNKRKKCHDKKFTNATVATCKVCRKPTWDKCAEEKSRVVYCMLFAKAAACDENIPQDVNMEFFRWFHQYLLNMSTKYQDDFFELGLSDVEKLYLC